MPGHHPRRRGTNRGGPLDGNYCECPGCPDHSAAPASRYPATAEHPDSDMYAVEVLGLRVMVRRRAGGSCIHVDTRRTAEQPVMPLDVEVNDSGTVSYESAPAPACPDLLGRPGKAVGELAGGDEIRHYQAMWHYILASWAVIAARAGDRDRWLAVAEAHFADARAAAAGTRWLAGLTTAAGQLIAPPRRDAADQVDAAAITGIAASALRTMPGTKFATIAQSVTSGLAQTSAPPYEKALAGLGRLAGATVLDRSGDARRTRLGVAVRPGALGRIRGENGMQAWRQVSAANAREAGGHLNYAAASAGAAAPPGSFAVIISPQQDVHHAALAVAGDRVYLVPPEVISDIAGRLTGAWDSIRIQARTLGPAEAEPVITQILHARRALPSQWLPSLTARRVADG